MNVQEIISSGLLDLYAAGMASEAEKQQVEAWRLQYPEVDAELNAIELALEKYAQANAVVPATVIKEKLFEKINTSDAVTPGAVIDINTKRTKEPVFDIWKWALAASVVLLMGSVVLNVSFYNKSEMAEAKLAETEQQLAVADSSAQEYEHDIRRVSLTGQPQTPNAVAKIYWMTNSGDVMVDASNLPDIPAGKQYQFWAIVDGKPVDGGLIITNDKGQKLHMQKMKSFGRAEAFAISLEKEGGNPTPTEVVSVGAVTKI